MNRQQRRAAARRQQRVPMVRLHDLTIDEADLLAEALDAYVLKQEDDLGSDFATWTPQQGWARGRATAIRDMLQASVEGRPTYDEHQERTAG